MPSIFTWKIEKQFINDIQNIMLLFYHEVDHAEDIKLEN